MIDLNKYMADAIKAIIKQATSAANFNIRELIYLTRFKKSATIAYKTREKYKEQGTHVPPFLIASITSTCNLFCSGCYARANNSCSSQDRELLAPDRYDKLFTEAEQLGISFILLAGGEPLMRKEIIDVALKHKKVMYIVFTNGTLIDDNYIKIINKNRNILPVMSIEGDKNNTDLRRGAGVYEKIDTLMKTFKRKKIFYGLSVTADKHNVDEVIEEKFLDKIYKDGCKVLFYIEYVPVEKGTTDRAFDDMDRLKLENAMLKYKEKYSDMVILSFPGDEKKMEGCLAAGRGFFHISVDGDAEPCPFSPYSDTNLKEKSILDALSSPLFKGLVDSGLLNAEHTGGCLLHEKEEEVKKLAGII